MHRIKPSKLRKGMHLRNLDSEKEQRQKGKEMDATVYDPVTQTSIFRITLTVIRVPRIVGCPKQILGSTMTRSNLSFISFSSVKIRVNQWLVPSLIENCKSTGPLPGAHRPAALRRMSIASFDLILPSLSISAAHR